MFNKSSVAAGIPYIGVDAPTSIIDRMADKKRYRRPPITEAVIELRFEGTFGEREMERVRARFSRQFPNSEEMRNVEFSVQAGGVTHKATPAGFKMTAKNAVDVVLINVNSLCTIRMAPYESWDVLVEAAEENFELFTKVLDRKKIIRIGARFVNRFDIPNALIHGKDIGEFILLGISLPEKVSNTVGPYSLMLNTVHKETGVKLLIQSAIIPPALIDHISITLDTDAFLDADIPSRVNDMWAKTAVLRVAKNSVFENSITDKLRELFQ